MIALGAEKAKIYDVREGDAPSATSGPEESTEASVSSQDCEWVTDSEIDGELEGETFEESFIKMRRRAAKVDEDSMFARAPEPPTQVYATLKNEREVALWFNFDHSEWKGGHAITGWTIKRYRREQSRDVYLEKGTYFIMEHEVETHQYILNNLQLGCMYRFTVSAQNARGLSMESNMSNPVMVEKDLPAGWFRFYDPSQERFYYSNIKTKQSTWVRPEENPYFADEAVILEFHNGEIEHTRDLFIEEIAHFDLITLRRFGVILAELGQTLPMNLIRGIFDALDLDNPHKMADNDTRIGIRLYRDFMLALLAVKQVILERSWAVRLEHLIQAPRRMYFNIRSRRFKRDMLHWKCRRDSFVCRDYYFNVKTHEKVWQMPDELRFYLSPSMQKKLCVFTPGDLSQFKYRFECLDLDGSGYLDRKEVEMLVGSLITTGLSKARLLRMIHATDFDGDGNMQYDEFCALMLHIRNEIQRKKGKQDAPQNDELSATAGGNNTHVTPSKKKSSTVAAVMTPDGFDGAFAEIESASDEEAEDEIAMVLDGAKAYHKEIEKNGMIPQALVCQPCELPPYTGDGANGRPHSMVEGEENAFLAKEFENIGNTRDAFSHLRPYTSDHGSRAQQFLKCLSRLMQRLKACVRCRKYEHQVVAEAPGRHPHHDLVCMCGCKAPVGGGEERNLT